jgi:hypothetical protein
VVRPSDHLELNLDAARRWIDVRAESGRQGRLFTADVQRLRATYSFSARSFVRAIAQHVRTERDPDLYRDEVDREDAALSGSLLFAYKLDWQTVLFLGYGDERALLLRSDRFEPAERQLFLKLSYAWQR